MYKIYNSEDFNKLTRGIKVAQCMQLKSSIGDAVPDRILQLDDLTISDSLSCSFCNTIFENQIQQRLHYKLDWHRYNLKQRLRGFKSITEDEFDILLDGDTLSSLSGIESDVDHSDDTDENSRVSNINPEFENKHALSNNIRNKIIERKLRITESMLSDSSDSEVDENTTGKNKSQAQRVIASRHSKVFFENADRNIFSIYRCLLHNKKEAPEVDGDMINQALASGSNTLWTVIMLGGGHFAAAIFQGGEAIAHKTLHAYTVRAKQGSSQSSRDNRVSGGHCKSAGANLRRYNEITLLQNIQEILESWSTHILNSSLILYRAVGPQNRTILFGGKNPPLNRNDSRLRPLPFPTKRATFNEVKRVHDILSTIEVYGSAAEFTDCFPISPRQPIRKKNSKHDSQNQIIAKEESIVPQKIDVATLSCDQLNMETSQTIMHALPDRSRYHRSRIDRAKPRKSPSRPLPGAEKSYNVPFMCRIPMCCDELEKTNFKNVVAHKISAPDIITKLAKSSSESEADCVIESNNLLIHFPLTEIDCTIEFSENLLEFDDTAPKNSKQKKMRKQRKKNNKNHLMVGPISETLINAKSECWRACKLGDNKLLSNTWQSVLNEVQKYEVSKEATISTVNCSTIPLMTHVMELMNEGDEDGNTMLHLAANGHHMDIIWQLLEIGIDPCKKNKKLQTAYVITTNKHVRNTFRRFMAMYPNKFDYNKSQIPSPFSAEKEQQECERRKIQRKMKREREKMKKKEFEIKKKEAEEKQRFLNLSDREKRALESERRIPHGSMIVTRCFQCGTNTTGLICFEYNSNRFCSMPCLKEHRLHNKFVI